MHKDVKEILYSHEDIIAKCKELAQRINEDYKDKEVMLKKNLKRLLVNY